MPLPGNHNRVAPAGSGSVAVCPAAAPRAEVLHCREDQVAVLQAKEFGILAARYTRGRYWNEAREVRRKIEPRYTEQAEVQLEVGRQL